MKQTSREKTTQVDVKIQNINTLLYAYSTKKVTLDMVKDYLKKLDIPAVINGKIRIEKNKKSPVATPLEWAISWGDWKLSQFLLELGANPNTGHEYPVIMATDLFIQAITKQDRLNYELILQLLKQYNVNCNVQSEGNRRQMYKGCTIYNLAIVCPNQMFVLNKICQIFPDINLNQVFPNGRTPILEAVANNHLPLVKFLCSRGVSLNSVTIKNKQHTPLADAARIGSREIVNLLLNTMKLSSYEGPTIQEIFEWGIKEWNEDILRIFLETGLINLNKWSLSMTTKDHGILMTPMHYVCERGDSEIVALFIKFQGKINSRWGFITPFSMAAFSNNRALCSWLLDSGLLDRKSVLTGWHTCNSFKDRKPIQELIAKKYFNKSVDEVSPEDLEEEDLEKDLGTKELGDIVFEALKPVIQCDNIDLINTILRPMHFEDNYFFLKIFHYALRQHSFKTLQFFLNSCDPLYEYEGFSAVFASILGKNEAAMNMFFQHYRNIGKTEELETHLLLCKQRIEWMIDSEMKQQCLQFITRVYPYFFKEKIPLTFNFFQSSTGHKYLQAELEGNPEKFNKNNQNPREKPDENLPKPKKPQEFTWCEGMQIDLDALKVVEGEHGYQLWIWLDKDFCMGLGCTEEDFDAFNVVRCCLNSSQNIKKLTELYAPRILEVNGVVQEKQPEFELRNSLLSRLMLYSIPSDCKRANILVPGKLLPGGLHKPQDSEDLKESSKKTSKAVKINLPTLAPGLEFAGKR